MERFPRSSKYNPEWVRSALSGAANPLWMAEWLAEALELRPGMRVLDLGCGRAASSVFLRKEYGVQVWAADLWFSPTENLQRIRDAGIEDGVFPLQVDARMLPFASGFFDAVISLDAFMYFATDDLYLGYLARYVRPGGAIGIAGSGLIQEIDGALPDHLRDWWAPETWCLHSAGWWRRHWERTGILEITSAEAMPEGWKLWLDWHRFIAPDNAAEIAALDADGGKHLGYIRVVGRRRPDVQLPEPVTSVATEYVLKSVLREP